MPFNEAWGQHRTIEVGRWVARRDPSRLVNIASGGNFWPVGDIVDDHKGVINGLLTYDRRVVRIPAAELTALHRQLFTAPK